MTRLQIMKEKKREMKGEFLRVFGDKEDLIDEMKPTPVTTGPLTVSPTTAAPTTTHGRALQLESSEDIQFALGNTRGKHFCGAICQQMSCDGFGCDFFCHCEPARLVQPPVPLVLHIPLGKGYPELSVGLENSENMEKEQTEKEEMPIPDMMRSEKKVLLGKCSCPTAAEGTLAPPAPVSRQRSDQAAHLC